MLELYQAEGCPHSADVRQKLTDLGVSYVIHNPRQPGSEGGEILNEQTQQAMEDIGGEDAIPFLVDTDRGETLYESAEIVDYLEAQYA